jgi:hypothetical protein
MRVPVAAGLLCLVSLLGCGSGGESACAGVVCDQSPTDLCLDAATLRRYEASGTCAAATGSCTYPYLDLTCQEGCSFGSCKEDQVAWGYVTLLESPDSLCEISHTFEWCDKVRGYFAVAPTYLTALPHQLDFLCDQKKTSGSCTHYSDCNQNYEPVGPPPKKTGCNDCTVDQECITPESGGWACRDLPIHWDVGALTVQGLKSPISFVRDAQDRYRVEPPPDDLFDPGTAIRVDAAGGQLGPFSLLAQGVTDLAIPTSVIEMTSGLPAVFAWTPADPGSRVELLLLSGWHFPFLPNQAILCEESDDAGQISVPAELVDEFMTSGNVYKLSRITRFTRQVIQPFGKEIELIVGSVRVVQVAIP